jgi:hypothetical protein
MEKPTLRSRVKNAWNAFRNRDPTISYRESGMGYTYRPDRVRFSRGNERSIVTSVYNRIAMDVAAIDLKHCRVDQNGQYIEDMKTGLNECLTLEANIDQTSRAFIQDVVMSMFDEGVVAIIPVDTDGNPDLGSFDVMSMRTAKILEWYPKSVKVRVYNDQTGQKQDIIRPKRSIAIIENPLFSVINEPNSTMQRLVRKLNLLDAIDEQSGSGKLDLIVQLPYAVKGELKMQQAEQRRNNIIDQLKGPYGIAYIDGTEKVTQLNRPVENNLMKQIEYLTNMLYSQIGMTPSVLDGTANETVMLNYNNRTIEPIVSAIVGAMKRNFLSKTARTQGQTIMSFRDPFKLVPINNIAEIADKFTRNEILTSNEIRQIIGFKPSSDPKADKLVNSNIAQPNNGGNENPPQEPTVEESIPEETIAPEEESSNPQYDNFGEMPLSVLST